jgi:hypothetical protein
VRCESNLARNRKRIWTLENFAKYFLYIWMTSRFKTRVWTMDLFVLLLKYFESLSSRIDSDIYSKHRGNHCRFRLTASKTVSRIAQSAWWLATGWTVRGSNTGGDEIFRTCPDWPRRPPSVLYNAYQVFHPGIESGWSMSLTSHPFLVPRSKRRSSARPLLSQRAFVTCKKGWNLPKNAKQMLSRITN